MNRRKFLKWLGIAPAVMTVVVTAPKLLEEPIKKELAYGFPIEPMKQLELYNEPNIGGWVSYKFHMTTSLPLNSRMRLINVEPSSEVVLPVPDRQ